MIGKSACCVLGFPIVEISVNVSVLLHDGGMPASADEFQSLCLLLTLQAHPEGEFDDVL